MKIKTFNQTGQNIEEDIKPFHSLKQQVLKRKRAKTNRKSGAVRESRLNNQIERVEKMVFIDNNDIETIKKAEKYKAYFENEGYKLVKTKQIGLDKFMLFYELKGGNK